MAGSKVWDLLKAGAVFGKHKLIIHDGQVQHQQGNDTGIVMIPDDIGLRYFLIQQYHDLPTSGHLGAYHMISSLSSYFCWCGLYTNVKEYCKKCVTCQASKVNMQAPVGQLQPLPTPTYNFEHITIDLITHLPTTKVRYDSVYTVADRLSKYVYFLPYNIILSLDDVAQLFLSNIVCKHSMLKHIFCDCDPWFTLRFWTQLMNSLGCQQSLKTAYCLQTDEQSEYFHRSVEQVLLYYLSANQKDWDRYLPLCQFALNSTWSVTTGYSPAVAVFNREPMLPMEHDVWDVIHRQVESVANHLDRMTVTNKIVQESVTKASKYMDLYAHRSYHPVTFELNDYIWLSSEHLAIPQLLTCILAAKFVGPYKITQVINPVAYHLDILEIWQIHNALQASQLKPTVGFVPGAAFDTPFHPGADSSVEFKVEDILDHRLTLMGYMYLVKQRGYPVVEATQEPISNLESCLDILRAYLEYGGLCSSRRGE